MAGAVVGALSAVMTVSAFAATAEYADGKVAVSGLDTSATGQMTVLVVPESCWDADLNKVGSIDKDSIYYIDQQANSDAATAWASLGVKGGELADGDYYVLVGGDNVASITAIKFTVGGGTVVAWCDVNRDESVNTADATQLLRYLATLDAWPEVYSSDEDEKLRVCDINKDESVNTADATQLLRYLATLDAWPTDAE